MAATELWGKVIGSYTSDRARTTLPSQLDLLRALHDMGPKNLALVFRLRTARDSSEDELSAIFDLHCFTGASATISPPEAQSLEDFAVVGLLPGYNLWASAHDFRKYKHHSRIIPVDGSFAELPIKADWSSLVDLLRRREHDTALDLTCTYVENHTSRDRDQTIPRVVSIDEATPFFKSAAVECLSHSHVGGQLLLSVTLHSTGPIDEVFAKIVGRLVLGVRTDLRPTSRYSLLSTNIQNGIVGCPEKLVRIWHAPYGEIQGRGNSLWNHTRKAMKYRPTKCDEPGITLGQARWHGARIDELIDVKVTSTDRSKHTYIVGKTGSGKTNLLKTLVRQDIANGNGCAVIDPHGDLINDAIEHSGERLGDIVLLDFSDPECLPLVNPFTLDVNNPKEFLSSIEEVLQIIVRRSYNQFTGPVFDDTSRMMFNTLKYAEVRGVLPPSIPLALEIVRTTQTRAWVAEVLKEIDPELSEQWSNFDKMLASTVAEHVRWAAAKFADFTGGNALQLLTSSLDQSPLSLQQIYDERKILLVKLPETSMGAGSAQFLGSLLFNRLYRAARNAEPETSRSPFYIYADEFQRFVSTEVEELVAEARKFNIGLTFAHQNLRQLESFSRFEGSSNSRLAEAIFSNVGTMIVMKTAGRDVLTFANEFSISEDDVRNIAQYNALTRSVVSGTEQPVFTLIVPHARTQLTKTKSMKKLRKRMIAEGYWKKRKELAKTLLALDQFRQQVPKTKRRSSSFLKPSSDTPSVKAGGNDNDGLKKPPSSFLDDWLDKRNSTRSDSTFSVDASGAESVEVNEAKPGTPHK